MIFSTVVLFDALLLFVDLVMTQPLQIETTSFKHDLGMYPLHLLRRCMLALAKSAGDSQWLWYFVYLTRSACAGRVATGRTGWLCANRVH